MTVAYVSAGATSSSTGATTLSPALPATPAVGDLLLAVCYHKSSSSAAITGTGWDTFITEQATASATMTFAFYIADGAQAAPTFTWTGSVPCAAKVFRISGNRTTENPAGAANFGTGTTTTHACTGVVTTSADTTAFYLDCCSANVNLATPDGWVENLDITTGGPTISMTVGHLDMPVAGATGDISVIGGGARWIMAIVEIVGPVVDGGGGPCMGPPVDEDDEICSA